MRARLTLAALAALLAISASSPAGAAASPAVAVFPMPGGRVASPQTQITFRGVPASRLGTLVVSGSSSGVHAGSVKSDSDGHGGSFIPDSPFKPGEVVTVRTALNILGASNGTFQFMIAQPAGPLGSLHWPAASRNPGDVWHFKSRPDILPAAVHIDKHGPTAPGYIFVASQYGPLQDGPEILDNNGNVVWFKSLPGNDSASDFRVQTYNGQQVLTWWQGYVSAGVGFGEDVINNSAYQVTNVIKAGNGLQADHHEFQISPQNTALITAEYPVYWDTSSIHGPKRQITFDSVVQEIDIPTGLVLFQWDSLDHVPVTDSYQPLPSSGASGLYDYFHVNSIDVDHDNNLLISSRNTWATYKVDRATARTIWALGGKHSSFRMGAGASFAFQHDVRVRSSHDWFITMFDDGGGPRVHSQSRGLKLFLDTKNMSAKEVAQQEHSPPLPADYEGNYQQLPGGDDFLGWGQQPYFTEYNSRGQEVFDGRFYDFIASYRAYRFPWNGTPHTTPALKAVSRGNSTYVYASWNGATNVAAWRVLAGSSPNALHTITTATKKWFEQTVTIGRSSYVQVQALDRAGHTLATSATVTAG